MIGAMRLVSVQRGYDPRRFVLVAFGGAGPLHANALARELGIPTVLVPPNPGIASPVGMLMTDIRHEFVTTRRLRVDALTPGARGGVGPRGGGGGRPSRGGGGSPPARSRVSGRSGLPRRAAGRRPIFWTARSSGPGTSSPAPPSSRSMTPAPWCTPAGRPPWTSTATCCCERNHSLTPRTRRATLHLDLVQVVRSIGLE